MAIPQDRDTLANGRRFRILTLVDDFCTAGRAFLREGLDSTELFA